MILFVSGGSRARLIKMNHFMRCCVAGQLARGLTIDVLGDKAVIVGGDYAHDALPRAMCVFDVTEAKYTFAIQNATARLSQRVAFIPRAG